MLNLDELNALVEIAFVDALGWLYEHSRWVMARAWTARPFVDVEAVHAAALAALDAASAEERLALIRAHPELAGKAAVSRDLTAASASEQAGAGLDHLTPGEFARFGDLNAAYGARFAFPFIICARLNDKTSILAAMDRRLGHTQEEEIAEAIVQIGLIGRLRLAGAVGL